MRVDPRSLSLNINNKLTSNQHGGTTQGNASAMKGAVAHSGSGLTANHYCGGSHQNRVRRPHADAAITQNSCRSSPD